MSIRRLRALVQFRLGSHSLPVEQGRFVRPCLPRHLRRCDLCNTQAVFKCFAEHGKFSPLVAGAPVEVQPDELHLSFQMQRQAAFDAVPLDPRSCPGPGVKLCTYRRWFSRPAHQVCPVY